MTDAITLREAVDIVRPMSPYAVNRAAQIEMRPSILRMVARMRRDEPSTFYGLCHDIDATPVRPESPAVTVEDRTWSLAEETVRREFAVFMSPSEVRRRLKLPKSSFYRMLGALERELVVERQKSGRCVAIRIGGRKVAAA